MQDHEKQNVTMTGRDAESHTRTLRDQRLDMGYSGIEAHGGALSDTAILEIVKFKPSFIAPFFPHLVSNHAVSEQKVCKVVSYGLSTAGYDARLAETCLLVTPGETVVDPKAFTDNITSILPVHQDDNGSSYVTIPPGGFVLAHTMETFDIPSDVIAMCIGKSTYARCGIHVLVTPLEPGWSGQVTLEIKNETSGHVKLYLYEGICQFVFHKLLGDPTTTYKDRGGKYQGQVGVVLPKV